MTFYSPNNKAIEKEQKDKKAGGYIQLQDRGNLLSIATDTTERIISIKAEAMAAELIWERGSQITSMKNQGITEAGENFFILSEQYSSSGPWHDFYIKPSALPSLITYLDNHPEAIKVRATYKVSAEIRREKFSNEKKSSHNESVKAKSQEDLLISQNDIPEKAIPKQETTDIKIPETPLTPKKENRLLSIFEPFIGIVILMAIAVAIITLNENHNGLGTTLFFSAIALVICYFLLSIIFANGIKQAPKNAIELSRIILLFFTAILILGSLGECSGSSSNSDYHYQQKIDSYRAR